MGFSSAQEIVAPHPLDDHGMFYRDQSETRSAFISILRLTLNLIFSAGATNGAMITMYASGSNRVAEISTLCAA